MGIFWWRIAYRQRGWGYSCFGIEHHGPCDVCLRFEGGGNRVALLLLRKFCRSALCSDSPKRHVHIECWAGIVKAPGPTGLGLSPLEWPNLWRICAQSQELGARCSDPTRQRSLEPPGLGMRVETDRVSWQCGHGTKCSWGCVALAEAAAEESTVLGARLAALWRRLRREK